MPIHSQATTSVTNQVSRALDLFCDRIDSRAAFVRYINAIDPIEKILFFYGDGGNGKTLLLHKLRRDYCRRLPSADRWPDVLDANRWNALTPDRKQEELRLIDTALSARDATLLPAVSLDFGGPARWLNDWREPVSALTELRRQLAELGFKSPVFDYGLLIWLHKNGQLHKGKLEEHFGSAHLDVATQLLETLDDIPLVSVAPKLLKMAVGMAWGRSLDLEITQRLARRNVDETESLRLASMDPASELPLELPRLLARDINVWLSESRSTHSRVVFFFDTHEAFWGRTGRSESSSAFHERDLWLRLFLGSLDFTAGIVVVMAGRERPRWPEASPGTEIPAPYIDNNLIGELSMADSLDYLAKAGIQNALMCEALMAVAEVEPGQHHPLYLGLCADTYFTMTERGIEVTPQDFRQQTFDGAPDRNGKGRMLVDRLLKYCDDQTEDAVRALSAARSFDWAVYSELANRMGLSKDYATFQRLVRYSFVSEIGTTEASVAGVDTRYRIHDLVRRILRARDDERVATADVTLVAIFDERAANGEELATAEALFHHCHVDLETGAEAWVAAFREAGRRSRHALRQALIGMTDEAGIDDSSHASDVAWLTGTYWMTLSRLDLAEAAYDAAAGRAANTLGRTPDSVIDLSRLADSEFGLARVCEVRTEYVRAATLFRQAITTNERALAVAPNDRNVWNSLGNCQRSLSDVILESGDANEAARLLRAAANSYRQALIDEPRKEAFRANQASVKRHLALMLLARDKTDATAETLVAEALEVYRDVTRTEQNDLTAWVNYGNVQNDLARMAYAKGDFATSEALGRVALTLLERALDLGGPDHLGALSRKGTVMSQLADTLRRSERAEEAISAYGAAIDCFERIFQLAPQYMAGRTNAGIARSSLADLLLSRSDLVSAEALYQAAVTDYRIVLSMGPNDANAYSNLASTLRGLAQCLESLERWKDAEAVHIEGCEALLRMTQLRPNDVEAWRRLALANELLVEHLKTHGPGSPDEAFNNAIAAYERALTIAPGRIDIRDSISNILLNRADALMARCELVDAERVFMRGIEILDESVKKFPDDANLWNSTGYANRQLAALLNRDPVRRAEANAAFAEAVEAYSHHVRIEPDGASQWHNLGFVHLKLGQRLAEDGKLTESDSHFREAIAALGRAGSIDAEAYNSARMLMQASYEFADLLFRRPNYRLALEQYVHSATVARFIRESKPDDLEVLCIIGVSNINAAAIAKSFGANSPQLASVYREAIDPLAHAFALSPDANDIKANLDLAERLLNEVQGPVLPDN
ncbi:tetratricopeptide repeat protein [Variovorax sp. M-6]|uniref:tetratricopeptide repeat protein n=1 Tax=Variovorax sp. M-6 TaxID=3233041 RepID=UPI003F9892A9